MWNNIYVWGLERLLRQTCIQNGNATSVEFQGPQVWAGQPWYLSPEGENSCKKENQERFTLLWDHFSIQLILSAWDKLFSAHTSQEKRSQLLLRIDH